MFEMLPDRALIWRNIEWSAAACAEARCGVIPTRGNKDQSPALASVPTDRSALRSICDGVLRRHHRSPAQVRKPAGRIP
jgi:hypothetical protein